MGRGSHQVLSSRAAACLWIPNFALVCERCRSPGSRGRPAALLSPTDARRLWQVSGEAHELGVRKGMTVGQGIGLAPTLVVLEVDPVHYAARFARLLEALRRVSPVVETGGQGLVFLGMDGLEPLYGSPKPQLRRVRDVFERTLPEVAEIGAPRLGWAVGKFVSWVAAATAAPGRPVIVPERETAEFLAARPVRVLPVAPAIIARLERLGLSTLAEVAALPEAALLSQFGRVGRRMWRCAAGKGLRYVRAAPPDEPVVQTLEFPEAVGVLEMLCRAVDRLVMRLLANPGRRGRGIRAVRLSARLEQGGSWSTEVVLKECSADPRVIARPLRHRLEQSPPAGPVKRLALVCTAFGPGSVERQLFERDASSSARGGREASLRAVAAELRSYRARLYRVMELAPWSRIPERRHALIDFDP